MGGLVDIISQKYSYSRSINFVFFKDAQWEYFATFFDVRRPVIELRTSPLLFEGDYLFQTHVLSSEGLSVGLAFGRLIVIFWFTVENN